MKVLDVIIIYLIYLIGIGSADSDRDAIRKHQTELMKRYMNASVDPCDNFYKYACGNWAQFNRIGDGELNSEPVELLQEKMKEFFNDVIFKENLTRISNENLTEILQADIVKKVLSYYRVCLREKRNSYEPYVKMFGLPGGWPALNASWSEDEFNWINVTGYLKLFGIVTLFEAIVLPHYSDGTSKSVYILNPEFPIFRQNAILNSAILQNALKIVIREIFENFGVNKTAIAEITDSISKFEIALAKISTSESDDEDPEDTSLETLSSTIPEINWKEFFNIISGEDLDSSQKVIIVNRPYLTQLVTLLNDTRPAVIANFFLYRFSFALISNTEIEESCTSEVTTNMGTVLGYIYNQVFNNNETNADVEQIVQNVKSAFADTIREANWLENATVVEALKKLEELVPKIGGFKENMTEMFNELEINPEDYYTNYLRLMTYTTRKPFQTLNKNNSRNELNFNPAEVNAFYDSSNNFIVIPTSILQIPIYSPHYPNSIKYGGLGTIIGHELTHSLNSSGREFDAKGNIRNWWTSKSTDEYTNRTECLITQYANYTSVILKGRISIENSTTLDEDIADNGGLRHAYGAYMNWLDQNKLSKDQYKDEILPELELTNKQLFFLSFAQFYCETIKPIGNFLTLLTDEHTPNKYRVIGSLTNFEEFSKEFQCPVGSKMNPAKKCKIW